MRTALIGLLFILWSASAEAHMTADDLSGYCAARAGTIELGICLGYINGSIDAMREKGVNICVPESIQVIDLVTIFQQFLKRFPESRHRSAPTLVGAVFLGSFPCR